MATKNSKKIGTEFETRLCNHLAKRGFWTHFLYPAPDGSQPFDIIAVRSDATLAIDCKALEKNRFPLSRVEDNQETSFNLLHSLGFYNTYFVIQVSENDVVFAHAHYIIGEKNKGVKSIPVEDLVNRFGTSHIE